MQPFLRSLWGEAPTDVRAAEKTARVRVPRMFWWV